MPKGQDMIISLGMLSRSGSIFSLMLENLHPSLDNMIYSIKSIEVKNGYLYHTVS